MQNEIIINADIGETRVAILERSLFSELYIERDDERGVVGNVVKGRVSRVLPGMQAAFVDIGLEKAGFLYVGDYFENMGSNADDGGGRKGGRRGGRGRQLPKIESVLREGQEIAVQIAKDPIGSKGARITSHISIPGRHLVLTPGAGRIGVSRRIDSDKERRRLREIVERLRGKDLGFIIRTAGHGVREADLEADIRYLTSVWEEIKQKMEEQSAPAVLYSELDLPLKMIRDFANSETKRIAIDSEVVFQRLKTFVDKFVADPQPKIEHYQGAKPIFDKFELEAQIHDNLERKVWLKSGGHLVVDHSEALTAIDVNTGRFTGKRDLEETIFKTNLEAVREVVYQLRFRNIGGLIIIDLIDMESADHREKVYRALQEALRPDKARTNILKISELGLVEMTRKRTRENLLQILCEPCSFCEGRGYVLSGKSVAFKVLREIRNDLPRFCGREIALTVSPQVAEQLLTSGQNALEELSGELGKRIEVRARPGLHQEQFELTALDQGEAVSIPLKWLGSPADADDEKAESSQDSEAGEDAGEAEAVAEAVDAADVPEKDANEEATAEAVPVVEEESAASSEASNPSDAVPQSDGDESEETEPSPLAASNPGEPEAPEESDEEPEMRAVALEREEGEAAQDAPEPEEEPKPDQDEPEVLDGEAETRILPGSRKLEES
jgi:ribonuclease G